jgi:hypothetical protein
VARLDLINEMLDETEVEREIAPRRQIAISRLEMRISRLEISLQIARQMCFSPIEIALRRPGP